MNYKIMVFIMEKLQEGYTIRKIGYNTYSFTINSDIPLELFLSPYLYK
jgi:hypothetical protein